MNAVRAKARAPRSAHKAQSLSLRGAWFPDGPSDGAPVVRLAARAATKGGPSPAREIAR